MVLVLLFSLLSKKSDALEPRSLGAKQATMQQAEAENAEQRKIFKKAEKYLHQPKSKKYQRLYKQLNGYALQPYLYQRSLIKNLNVKNEPLIETFLHKHKGTPLDWPLRKAWLRYIAKNKKLSKKQRAKMFLKSFKPTSNAELTCQQLEYRLITGLPESVVLPQVTKLWLVGKSQVKACNGLFKRWKKAGYQTQSLVWQRIELAADGGKHTLLPYLTKLLNKNERYLGSLWHKVRRDPAYITRLSHFPKKSAKEAQIMLYGLKRLIWRDPNRALRTYKKAQQAFKFSYHQQQKIMAKFAVALSAKSHKLAQIWLDKVSEEYLTKSMVQWRLTALLKQQDWSTLITELKALPKQHKDGLQWKYWYARALISTNEKQRGELLLAQLANERHYYGFLAASYLQAPVNLQNKPLTISLAEKKHVLDNAAAKRAFELFYLERYNQARREWNYWLSTLTNRQKLIASKVANDRGWFDRAIFTLSKVGYLDDVELRFPKAYSEKIHQFANKHKINPAWAFAITRRESSFMEDAHSSAGARGLMQLMPATARKLKRGKVTNHSLLNANTNIALGTKYLKELLVKNKGNQVLATASYNAGPYRVKRWLKKAKKLPADIWIETIPYKETRNYVKSVLAYQEIYQHQPGKVSSIFDDVVNMTIGH